MDEDSKLHHLDFGHDEEVKLKEHWWQLWLRRPKGPPLQAPLSFDAVDVMPLNEASLWSVLTFAWITPLMTLGYQRPLQATDLWKMDSTREVCGLVKLLDASWARRVDQAKEWNAKVKVGKIRPTWTKKSFWAAKALTGIFREGWQAKYTIYIDRWSHREANLAWALNDTLGWQFWIGGTFFSVFGDTVQLMGPLLAKAIINFGKEHFAARESNEPGPNIERGIGLAIGLFCVTCTFVVLQQQSFWCSMSTGVLARSALIASIYKRGVFLAPAARPAHPNSALLNHMSTDVSRIDYCAAWFYYSWTAPIQIIICLIILLVQLGPSALAGFCVLIITIPIQKRAMVYQFKIRKGSMRWTDQRASLTQELLGGMRVVKWFTYEKPFLKRLWFIRHMELKGIWWILFIRAGNHAASLSFPALSATVAFVTYSLSGNSLDPAVIFSSLSLFQLLRQPMSLLPIAFSSIVDAQSAITRLNAIFHAELINQTAFEVDPGLGVALRVDKASFQWEHTNRPDHIEVKNVKKNIPHPEKNLQGENRSIPREPFSIKNLDIEIPRGRLSAIVGPVGSGKSSILLGLIGEMRRTGGSCTFGGSVAYCAQSAWIKNGTLRDNILFGRPFDKERYWKVLQDSCLLPDLDVLPDSDIVCGYSCAVPDLSGGQKQRVNIARALYRDADIVIFDDPLSAVDAHVGKALFANAILGSLKAQGKTVILVTHALHFLPEVDFVYTVVNGDIAEQGTYDELIKNDGPFAKLATEFGLGDERWEEKENQMKGLEESRPVFINNRVGKEKVSYETLAKEGSATLEGRLMRAEKRITGSVSFKVYISYLRAGKGVYTIPFVIISAVLMQASWVLNSYLLVWWQADTFHRSQAFYIIIYGCLGLSQAFFAIVLGTSLSWFSILASENLHWKAMEKILHAPMSFFDTTPLGRMMSVLGKDVDVLDNQLSESLREFILTLSMVFGSVLIVTILTHYFILPAALLFLGYMYFASFHRNSARELKRLDAHLRSLLYSHFSESLSGLPTIRSYGETPRYLADNEYYIDLENRALYPTITNQRWLAIRLGFLSAILVLVVGILAVVGINGITPAQIGLILTYTTSLTQFLNITTQQSSEVENFMSSVERVAEYSDSDILAQEAPHEKDDVKPSQGWPSEGAIEFKDVMMSYRPGLDPVLKGVSMSIRSGEKIGIVGRTGAGKSSLMVALFRLVELSSGSIHIDGIDISSLGLRDLRSKIAIIPQEPLLFSGTIRTNLDPFSVYDDTQLWDALRRAYLVEARSCSSDEKIVHKKMGDIGRVEDPEDSGSCTTMHGFSLETVIESEGANLSVGERSLLSLARALVGLSDAKVIVLDEATASVDFETDRKIQITIREEFKNRTLLCIAHRLRTILAYDRILVMDNGQISQFGPPVDLFKKENGIFYTMCLKSNITLSDIENSSL
ncbi:ABC protein [Hysterangium stoloniferum]|nr:ABC protein [Hysterangium stoloniferum]